MSVPSVGHNEELGGAGRALSLQIGPDGCRDSCSRHAQKRGGTWRWFAFPLSSVS